MITPNSKCYCIGVYNFLIFCDSITRIVNYITSSNYIVASNCFFLPIGIFRNCCFSNGNRFC